MGSSRHRCNCDYCVTGRTAKAEWQHGGMDWDIDEDELLPYRKSAQKNIRRKGKACKKSKTKEACVFNTPKVIGTEYKMNYKTKKYEPHPNVIMTCERCGRYDYGSYNWGF